VGLQPGQHVRAHGLHQTVIDGLVEIAERLAVQRVHPVVYRGAHGEPLARHIVARQLGQFAVIDTRVPIDVKRQTGSLFGLPLPDPLFGQRRIPTRRPALLGAQQF